MYNLSEIAVLDSNEQKHFYSFAQAILFGAEILESLVKRHKELPVVAKNYMTVKKLQAHCTSIVKQREKIWSPESREK